jgi:hypothetical protein
VDLVGFARVKIGDLLIFFLFRVCGAICVLKGS